ncbi:hypothetical protein DFH06DRAFT_1134317 [Mycena polygramma]|nr:hypothetical protein DFH06DRAFT_1134317 [Mycena polygramma]
MNSRYRQDCKGDRGVGRRKAFGYTRTREPVLVWTFSDTRKSQFPATKRIEQNRSEEDSKPTRKREGFNDVPALTRAEIYAAAGVGAASAAGVGAASATGVGAASAAGAAAGMGAERGLGGLVVQSRRM